MNADVRREARLRRVAAHQGLHPGKGRSVDSREGSTVVDNYQQPDAVDHSGHVEFVDHYGGTDDIAAAVKVAQNPTAAAGITVCAKYKAQWSGYKTGHCAACHQTFTVVSAFDLHRVGSHSKGERHCAEPAAVGLVDSGRAYPCWGHPGHAEVPAHRQEVAGG